jgi:hypothetical protein
MSLLAEWADHLRRYRDLHALLTAGLSMATERFSPLQKLAPGSGGAGLRGGLAGMVKEAAENPLNNMVQGTLIDPLIGEHPDVVGDAPSDFLSGLMTAGVMKTGETTVGGSKQRANEAEFPTGQGSGGAWRDLAARWYDSGVAATKRALAEGRITRKVAEALIGADELNAK